MRPSDIFTCQKCGECCKGYGGTFVTDGEIHEIAAYLGVVAKRFVDGFCRFSGNRPVLGQRQDGYCVFWDGLCTIHPVKPRMCRDWPFIEGVLRDRRNWEIMAGMCPGIRADAPYDEVVRCVRQVLGLTHAGPPSTYKTDQIL